MGHYTFDSTSVDGNDSSPSGSNDGVVVGATTVVDGTRGDVLSFDGNDYIEIAGHYGDPANVTLSAWVNLTAYDTLGANIISLGDSAVLHIGEWSGGSIRGGYYDGSSWHNVSFTTNLAGTGWHHLAYTIDDTNNVHTIYLDGVEIGSSVMTGSVSYTLGSNSTIGKHGDGDPSWDLIGQLDEARVYDRALTATEIARLVNDLNLQDVDAIAITVDPVNDAPTFITGDGSAITSIAPGSDLGYSMAVQADGKILVTGRTDNGTDYDIALLRYNADGTLDTTFSGDGIAITAIGSGHDTGYSVTVQTDGKILVAGYSYNGTDNDFALVRYNTDGSLDTTFSSDGITTTAIGAVSDKARV